MEDKKYQVTIQWSEMKNGVQVSENHTGRFDTQSEEDAYRIHALSFLPKETIEQKMEAFVEEKSSATDAPPICPKHKKVLTLGKWGWYCKTPDPSQPKGWCTYKG
jgi:hypothetical protein